MKKEIDPKIFGAVIGALVLIIGAGYYFVGRGQGDRSGPVVEAKYQGGGKALGAGWHPGAIQGAGGMRGGAGTASIPGSQSEPKKP